MGSEPTDEVVPTSQEPASDGAPTMMPPSFQPSGRPKGSPGRAGRRSRTNKPHATQESTDHVAGRGRHPSGAARVRVAASVLVVTLACGLLFAASASTARSTSAPSDVSLVALVRNQEAQVSTMEADNSQLSETVDAELAQVEVTPTPSPSVVSSLTDAAVEGPGVSVKLTDSPLKTPPEGASQEDLIVHQQDLEAVMNALWTGGAEAMAVQGKRVTSRSVILCIGNVIYVDGGSFSPPYVISAIGDPDRLKDALNADIWVGGFKRDAGLYGLGYDLETNDDLHFDAARLDLSLTYAHTMENDG